MHCHTQRQHGLSWKCQKSTLSSHSGYSKWEQERRRWVPRGKKRKNIFDMALGMAQRLLFSNHVLPHQRRVMSVSCLYLLRVEAVLYISCKRRQGTDPAHSKNRVSQYTCHLSVTSFKSVLLFNLFLSAVYSSTYSGLTAPTLSLPTKQRPISTDLPTCSLRQQRQPSHPALLFSLPIRTGFFVLVFTAV